MLRKIIINRINKYIEDAEKIVEQQVERSLSTAIIDMSNRNFTPEELRKLNIINSKIVFLGMMIKEK